ncbi:hypothetical protein AM493_09210 [Flavobacterium akiainvivens]|uniref:Putative beta-lactamase-inhibitor-like PepSY-like domain-containing protein n=2 Tax=Flavobacterium akiainvivens TaxID=1202724 RepID=A0A0M9VK01_9FLAO|nr:hypothetical protein AM493_09210 [Flavobacterium akiainvivens]
MGCNAQKRNIAVTELPKIAQEFIKTNFPNQATSYIIEDKDIHETEYVVHFTGGAEVEFDGKGNWKEVDANHSIMPKSVLPKAVAAYVDQNYKGQNVEKIEHKHWGYKVEFTNDIELEFDNAGKFLRIDD